MKKLFSIRWTVTTAVAVAILMFGCAEDPEALVVSAKAFLSKNDSKSAIIQLRNALQKDPDIAEARFLLGRALLDTGDVRGAEKELRIARELQHPADEVVPPFARTLVLLGQYKSVIDELSNVQLAQPQGRAELLTAVGEAHYSLGDAAAARNAFAMALMARPEYVPAHRCSTTLTRTRPCWRWPVRF